MPRIITLKSHRRQYAYGDAARFIITLHGDFTQYFANNAHPPAALNCTVTHKHDVLDVNGHAVINAGQQSVFPLNGTLERDAGQPYFQPTPLPAQGVLLPAAPAQTLRSILGFATPQANNKDGLI